MTTGQFIREQRSKKGMTQEDLAARTEVSVRTIQRIENDEVEARAYTLQNIATALEVDFAVLKCIDQETEAQPADRSAAWLTILHLSGAFNLLLPSLIIWLVKRHRVNSLQQHAIAVLNFQLSMIVYQLAYILFVIIFMPNLIPFGPTLMLLVALILYSLAMVIINTIRVLTGQPYRYPLSLHFLKPATTDHP